MAYESVQPLEFFVRLELALDAHQAGELSDGEVAFACAEAGDLTPDQLQHGVCIDGRRFLLDARLRLATSSRATFARSALARRIRSTRPR